MKSAIGITTLIQPVVFGNKENDPVKYLCFLSAKDSESHINALTELTGLLKRDDFYEFLDHAKDASEVMQYMKNL